MKLSEYAKRHSISYRTAHRHWKQGFIKGTQIAKGKTIEIINNVQDNAMETMADDLMQDFVAIITSFTARLYGLRRSQRKTEAIIKELHENE